ncbi:aldo/keto reductase [Clostridium sp.]|uniref:aldo/keto reductase n=1 Tax=Clostridium sp. TaxID=1506 RepID=UPI002FC75A17
MQYRKFGQCDFTVSTLGFGSMRFPVIDNDSSKINEEEAISMIRHAVDNGVNYIDTAYPYHSGNSEILVGKALQDGYRKKVRLATKSPVWLIKEYADFEKYLNEQLTKLQTNYIDFYLLHALNKERFESLKNNNVFKFLDEAIVSGKIKYAGFSFHDEEDVFYEIANSYPWTFCQIQLNYMDVEYQAGLRGLKYAAEKGMAVVIMEPLKGGKLAGTPPTEVKELFEGYDSNRTPAHWALKWLYNFPEVTTVLSGMSTMEQLKENLIIASQCTENSMNNEELEIMNKAKNAYLTLTKVNCTGCNYCQPCPFEVDIPRNFEIYNEGHIFNTLENSTHVYNNLMPKNKTAANCVECGKCEDECPQNLPIRKLLKDVHNSLSKK